MSGQNVVRLHPKRPARRAVDENGAIATLVFVIVEAMMFAGLVSAFMLTRATAAGVWPPAGLPLGETAINTAALLISGGLVFRAAQAWEKRETQTGPLLTAAIALGAFFVFFQGVVWVAPIRQGLALTSSHHGVFFCIIVGAHAVPILGALIFMGAAWLRLKRGAWSSSIFSAARVLWYFLVGVWPVLYLCLYL